MFWIFITRTAKNQTSGVTFHRLVLSCVDRSRMQELSIPRDNVAAIKRHLTTRTRVKTQDNRRRRLSQQQAEQLYKSTTWSNILQLLSYSRLTVKSLMIKQFNKNDADGGKIIIIIINLTALQVYVKIWFISELIRQTSNVHPRLRWLFPVLL